MAFHDDFACFTLTFSHLKEPALLGPGHNLANSVSTILYFNSKTVLNFIFRINILEQFRFDKASYKIDQAFLKFRWLRANAIKSSYLGF